MPSADAPEGQALAEADDARDELGLVGLVLDVVYGRLVDLQHVDRKLLEVGEDRAARAEVVDRQAQAELLQTVQLDHRALPYLLRMAVAMLVPADARDQA